MPGERIGVAAILTVFGLGAALAQTGPTADSAIACEASGYDVIIRNTGTEPIAEGTPIKWSVPFVRRQGTHALDAALEPGGRVFVSGGLGSTYLDQGRPCTAAQE